MAAQREIDLEGLRARVEALPGFGQAREAAERVGADAHLVGGAVRDALLGIGRADLDLVVVGDQMELVEALGEPVRVHDRFGTATVELAHGPVDVAQARRETYPRPGGLPEVTPGSIGDDLARRDFTINAMAVSLGDPAVLEDRHGGLADLGAGLLRVLHGGSFVDDPTRALRAARYAARLDLELEPETAGLLGETDLTTVSSDRVAAELGKLAGERRPWRGFELLNEWGLVALAPGASELIQRVAELVGEEPWAMVAPRATAVLAAVRGPSAAVHQLATLEPAAPSLAVEAARHRSGVELVLARVLGAEWLDRYVGEWRGMELEITGEDLIAAGVAEGPAVGRGLAAAFRARLDGEARDRDAQLRIALEAASS